LPALAPRPVALSAPSTREALLATKRRRLGVLEVQAARKGYNAPPEAVVEIEDLRAEIAALEQDEG
jgi:hypothetical protein